MRVLICGGTGFIGQALVKALLRDNHEVICHSRDRARVVERLGNQVKGIVDYNELGDETVDAVVNLAGEPIADQRWSSDRKALLRSSRIDTTSELVKWIESRDTRPDVLISGSAIGYYGNQETDNKLTESDEAVAGFTHQLCADWEAEALKAKACGVRVCLIRTGIVLGKGGGALSKMLPPFRLGLGGPIANGLQWMSWIHLEDQVAAILFLLHKPELEGAFNLTAPEAATNGDFSRALAAALHRPAFFTVPAFVIRMMLGEGAELLLGGQRVYPMKLTEAGFSFKYPQLKPALATVV